MTWEWAKNIDSVSIAKWNAMQANENPESEIAKNLLELDGIAEKFSLMMTEE
jgi:hypothetical protein